MSKPDDTKPVSVRLNELKKPLELVAAQKEWSLHKLIRKACKDLLKNENIR